jgi:DNA-binding response OmpR family regulator
VTVFDDGTLHVDFAQRLVTIDGQSVHLNSKEYLLLAALVRGEGQPVSIPELIVGFCGNVPPATASTAVKCM